MMLHRKTQLFTNYDSKSSDDANNVATDDATACLMYYLHCIQKLNNQTLNISERLTRFHEYKNASLGVKQDILAFSYLYSPENFLNKSVFLIEEEEESDTVGKKIQKPSHFFTEKCQLELDDDCNCSQRKDACLFITFAWLEKFYARPMQELSDEIQRQNNIALSESKSNQQMLNSSTISTT